MMSDTESKKHPHTNPIQDSPPAPKKFRSPNEQCLNFANPPENIFNSLKFPRKTKAFQASSIPSLHDTVSSVIPPPFPALEYSLTNADDPATTVSKLTPKKVQQYYRCKECQLFLSSQSTLDAHFAGARHAKKLKELRISNIADDLKKEKVVKSAENEFKCKICNVSAGSLIQIKSHIDGSKHKKKMKAYKDNKHLKKNPNEKVASLKPAHSSEVKLAD